MKIENDWQLALRELEVNSSCVIIKNKDISVGDILRFTRAQNWLVVPRKLKKGVFRIWRLA
jgi:hypothetical protein